MNDQTKQEKIEEAKKEIARRAIELGLKFDPIEIVDVSLDDLEDTPDKYKGKTIVLLRSVKKIRIVEWTAEDGSGVNSTIEKWDEPIVWFETIRPDTYADNEKRVIHYILYKPKFVVMYPELMILI